MTRAATEFIAPLTFEALTGRPVHTALIAQGHALDHIKLARAADAVVVAPATADFCARAAHGRADDLLAAILLATEARVLLVPAMNDRMWAHKQTQAQRGASARDRLHGARSRSRCARRGRGKRRGAHAGAGDDCRARGAAARAMRRSRDETSSSPPAPRASWSIPCACSRIAAAVAWASHSRPLRGVAARTSRSSPARSKSRCRWARRSCASRRRRRCRAR